MPYDPNFPGSHAELTSPAFREQFNGLKDLIDAGPPADVVGGVPKLVPRDLFLFQTASAGPNLVDGNPDTYQSAGDGVTTGFAYSVDLGSPADITTIKIAGAPYAESSFTDVTVDLRYSDDGAAWTVIAPLLVHPDDATLQALTFPSVGAHRYWGFIVTNYATPGYHAPFSEMQGFDGITAVLAPAATAGVQAAAAADATAKADAVQAAAAAALNTLTPSQIGTLGFPAWDGGGSYAVGNVVSYAGVLYLCISAIPGAAGNPTLLPFSWTPISSMFEAVATAAQGATADSMNGAFLGSPIKLPFGWNFLGFEVWDGATAYHAGDALTYAGALYVAIAAHSAVPPDSNPAIWALIPTFFDLAGTATAKADAVLAASSNNTNAVATLDTPFANDPPTLADLEVMRAKQNELILALRR